MAEVAVELNMSSSDLMMQSSHSAISSRRDSVCLAPRYGRQNAARCTAVHDRGDCARTWPKATFEHSDHSQSTRTLRPSSWLPTQTTRCRGVWNLSLYTRSWRRRLGRVDRVKVGTALCRWSLFDRCQRCRWLRRSAALRPTAFARQGSMRVGGRGPFVGEVRPRSSWVRLGWDMSP